MRKPILNRSMLLNRSVLSCFLGLLLLCIASASSQNVYAYNASRNKPMLAHKSLENKELAIEAITGKVTGADGSPVPGVSITVKGTKKGVSSDAKGAFS